MLDTRRDFLAKLGVLSVGATLFPSATAWAGTSGPVPASVMSTDAPSINSAEPSVNVMDFGAIGDGEADDTIALQRAIASAGVNGSLLFPPGKRFITHSELRPLAGQTWYGYGACIKRGDQIVTRTTDYITTSTNRTTIRVADASRYRVGMKITVTTGRNESDGCYEAHEIVAINGNQLTVRTNFRKPFPMGGVVVTNHGLIRVNFGTDRVRIYGLELDGNRANNDTYLNWQTQAAVVSGAHYAVFRDLYIHDSTADGIMVGGIGTVVASCTILSSGGNAVHLSGATSVKVVNNFCKDATLSIDGTNNSSGPAHAEGVLTFSSLIVDATIIGNHFENGRTCIGGIGDHDNSDITILGNTMRGATLYTIEFITGETRAPALKNLVVTGNRIYDSAPVTLVNVEPAGTDYAAGNHNVVFAHNLLTNTCLVCTRLKHANIEGNLFDCAGDSEHAVIALTNPRAVIVHGNQIIGGKHGVLVRHEVPASGVELAARNVLISGNSLRNQTDTAIHAGTPNRKTCRNVKISGNIIASEDAAPGYVSIHGGSGVEVTDNSIDQRGGGAGIVCGGDNASNPVGIPGTLARGNMVRTSAGVSGIRILDGTKGSIVHSNYTVQGISPRTADGNVVENNHRIP